MSGWNVHSMRGTCESRRVLRKVSFFCVGERRARRAQAEGRGTAPGGGTETVLVVRKFAAVWETWALYSQWLEDDEQ